MSAHPTSRPMSHPHHLREALSAHEAHEAHEAHQ